MSEIIEETKTLTPEAIKKMSHDNGYAYVPIALLDYEFASDEMADLDDGLGGKLTIREAYRLMWGKEIENFTDTHALVRYSMNFKEMKLLEDIMGTNQLQLVYDIEDIDFTNPYQAMILIKLEAQELVQKLSEYKKGEEDG
jgi:hypothetical protein